MRALTGMSAALSTAAAIGSLAAASGVLTADANAEDTNALNSTALSSAAISSALETQITDGAFEAMLAENLSEGVPQAARAAYARNLFQPIWTYDGQSFEEAIRETARRHDAEITPRLSETLMTIPRQPQSAEQLAQAEIAMSCAFLQLAEQVSRGLQDEGAAVRSPKAAPAHSQTTQALLTAANGDIAAGMDLVAPARAERANTAPAIEPVNGAFGSRQAPRDYQDRQSWSALNEELEHYRDIAADGGWRALPEGELIEAGDSDPRIPLLRQRLEAEGFYAGGQQGFFQSVRLGDMGPDGDDISRQDVYGPELQNALKAFQARHGLKRDGVVGPRTLEALNESVESKIARIETAMQAEREIAGREGKLIRVNIPSYQAEAWEDGKEVLSMKAIVGKKSTPTPSFSDEAEFIVANPRWYVPTGLMIRQKLSKLRADPGYADAHNFIVYDRESGDRVSAYNVNWHSSEAPSRYRLVQKAGPWNALGELKIKFPNKDAIYLHGTPDDHLFAEDERAFSSGCIRLEDPVKFASWTARAGGATDDVESAVRSGDNQRISLARKIPVEITYDLTTVEDGEVYFWRDIYQRKEQPVMMAEPAQISSEQYASLQAG